MADYSEWNYALVTYFTEGIHLEARIYLSVDEDVLKTVGEDLDVNDDAVEDFLSAVRATVVKNGEVSLGRLLMSRDNFSCAFLSLCVLAANHMMEDEEISESNYFTRLRQLLGFEGSGRPPGLDTGYEEPLWLRWNRFLRKKGFMSTATPGEHSQKFIHYPISQTLLRETDKTRLRKLFADQGWGTAWDADTILSRIRDRLSSFPVHLRRLVEEQPQRRGAVSSAIHEVYLRWLQGTPTAGSPTRAFSGLYREEDPFMGEVEYYFYPRAPRHRRLNELVVLHNGENKRLKVSRPGYYTPFGPIPMVDLTCGTELNVVDERLETLVLEKRDFWVLVPDPEDQDSGIYGTWGAPGLGSHFVILCRPSLLKELNFLKEEELLRWGEEVKIDDDWLELRDCLVTSESWSSVVKNTQLIDALTPYQKVGMSFSGGLRVPGRAGWFQGHGPVVRTSGFHAGRDLTVLRVDTENPNTVAHIPNVDAKDFNIKWEVAGTFLVRVSNEGSTCERLVTISSWDELSVADTIESPETVDIGDFLVRGALVERKG